MLPVALAHQPVILVALLEETARGFFTPGREAVLRVGASSGAVVLLGLLAQVRHRLGLLAQVRLRVQLLVLLQGVLWLCCESCVESQQAEA